MSRRRLLIAPLVGLAFLAGLISALKPGEGRAVGGPLVVEPVIGLPAADVQLIGAPASGVPGELWGLGTARGVPALDVTGNPQPPAANGFVLVHRTESGGWELVPGGGLDTFRPIDRGGPGPGAGRVTPDGGLVIPGTSSGPDGYQPTIIARDPGRDARPLPDPGPAVLTAGESLVAGGRVAMAAVDDRHGTGLFAAALGASTDSAVLHWDGATWEREAVDIPAESASSFRILAIAAREPGDAWLLARESATTGRGVVLFERRDDGGPPHWVERTLDGSPFGRSEPPGTGVRLISGLPYPADALSVAADGIWVDGSLQRNGKTSNFTLFLDTNTGSVVRSWCDVQTSSGAGLCDRPLGAAYSASRGYRSFAFGGPDTGGRIVTDPLGPDGDSASGHGTWLLFQGGDALRIPGIGARGNEPQHGGAFSAPDVGWIGGGEVVGQVRRGTSGRPLAVWPVTVRRPLLAVTPQPASKPGDLGSAALAVGAGGTIARYAPATGWSPEFLLNGLGQRATPTLRSVAWPEPGRAYAVGDGGEMWIWREDTGLWERDEAAPDDLVANLAGIAFSPADPARGFAVGDAGTILHFDKTWTADELPSEAQDANLTSVAFAGPDALVAAGRHLLVNDGSGWKVDGGAQALIDAAPNSASITAVAGLPDGGAVAAGRDLVLERDHAGAPWRSAERPLRGLSVVAAAAIRSADRVRAVVSVTFEEWPAPKSSVGIDPGQPAPLLPPTTLPRDGYVLREGADGWRDEERAAFRASTGDLPVSADPVLAFNLGPEGSGWAVGGTTGEKLSGSPTGGIRARVQSAAVMRYDAGGAATGPAAVQSSPVPTASAVARFAVAGNAVCAEACADLANQTIGPDAGLETVLSTARLMAGQQHGPRAVIYTGGRVRAEAGGLTGTEALRYAQIAGAAGGIPFFPALGAGDAPSGTAAAFSTAFAGFPAPLGLASAPAAVDVGGIPGVSSASGARTHYAFDSTGPEGTVRVVVIDNSAGSLGASDPHQVPREPQLPWLTAVLDDARSSAIPTIVVGTKDLNSSATPTTSVATDADQVAALLVEHGASAYFFDRPGENRTYPIPAGSATPIPSFGTGTAGYGTVITNAQQFFGESGLLLAEVDVGRRDAATNRAPVQARLIPAIQDLAIDSTDGVLLRRSRVALFQGLARRARAGQPASSDATPDPFLAIPPAACLGSSACATRIPPEFTFSSADPDLGDFVAHDPQSTNPRAILLDDKGTPVPDPASGLFCAFNAGTTTVTIRSGGLAYSQKIRILSGAVQRPCGTRPKDPSRFTRTPAANPPPPAGSPASTPATSLAPPPPPAPAPASAPPPAIPPSPPVLNAPVPVASVPPAIPPPPPSFFANTIPPGGSTVRVQEEKREEEAAPESSSAFSAVGHDDLFVARGLPTIGALVLLAALGASGFRMRRRRSRPVPATARYRS